MRKLNKLKALLSLQNSIGLLVLLACLGIGWWFMAHANRADFQPMQLLRDIDTLGWVGIAIFISISALAIIVSPIPGTPFTLAAGAVWGPIHAGVYAIAGIFVGSLIAYFIGRTLGRSVVQALTGKIIHLSNHRGEIFLGWIMFVSHLLPGFPFDLMSYGAGISGLSFPIYFTATLLGLIPGTFFLTYMGSTFKDGTLTGAAVLAAFLLLVAIFLWAVKRYNWLNLRDIVRWE